MAIPKDLWELPKQVTAKWLLRNHDMYHLKEDFQQDAMEILLLKLDSFRHRGHTRAQSASYLGRWIQWGLSGKAERVRRHLYREELYSTNPLQVLEEQNSERIRYED